MFCCFIDINLIGFFFMFQLVGCVMMVVGKFGFIIFVVFMFGFIVNYLQEQFCYNVFKVGVIQFGKFFVVEWVKYQICVNCIFFGYMDMVFNKVFVFDV